MDEPRCTTCGLVMTPKNAKLRPELFYCDGCLPVMFRPMPAEHTSNAPHTTQAAALYAELMDMIAKRDAALAERDRLLESVKGHLADKLTLCEERDAAEAERDRLRQKYADLDAIYDQACGDHIALRDAARDFLALLDRTTFSVVALKGKKLDELRRLCE